MSPPTWRIMRWTLIAALLGRGITALAIGCEVDPIFCIVCGVTLLGTLLWEEFWFHFTYRNR